MKILNQKFVQIGTLTNSRNLSISFLVLVFKNENLFLKSIQKPSRSPSPYIDNMQNILMIILMLEKIYPLI